MAHHYKYILVGGGLAAASAVEGIRKHDRSGSVAVFGKEPHLPYDRPPLSKGLWFGKSKEEELPVHAEPFYKKNNVHLFLGHEVRSIDRQKKQITDQEGSRYTYDKILLATGGTPKVLSFGGDAIQYFRTVDDYHALLEVAGRKDDFLLIGGGFIGAELAAALNSQGKHVTMIFPDQFILAKILPADLAEYVTGYYREKGVDVLAGDLPTSAGRSDGRIRIATRSGNTLDVDFALAAIGLNLHTEMAAHAGITIENGIRVNNFLQTSDPHIYAAGDVAMFPAKLLGKSIRVEHWNNAQVQGMYAGENMAGAQKSYDYLPYFYSDLFDLGFEAVGELDSRMETFADWREEFREGVVYYLHEGKLKGVLLWNVWEKVDAARNLIGKGKTYDDPRVLKKVL